MMIDLFHELSVRKNGKQLEFSTLLDNQSSNIKIYPCFVSDDGFDSYHVPFLVNGFSEFHWWLTEILPSAIKANKEEGYGCIRSKHKLQL